MATIDELTRVVIERCRAGDEKGRASCRDYKAAGDALNEIWKSLEKGEKVEWLETYWEWSQARAYQLKDISKHWDQLLNANDGREPLGWNDARRLLSEVKPTRKKPKPINPAKLVKSKLAKSISGSVAGLNRDLLLYLCDRPESIEYFIDQMQDEIAPLAGVMSGWSAAEGFKQPQGEEGEYTDEELRERMTDHIVSEFKDASLTEYQEQVIHEYFEIEYDTEVADQWRTYFSRQKNAA